MNNYDSDRLAQTLYATGWMQANQPEEADLLMLNTCTVRQLAEEKAFSLIGRWHKLKQTNPNLMIGMTGCLAQYLGDQAFQRAPTLDFIIGPRSITKLPEIIERARNTGKASYFDIEAFGTGGGAVQPSSQITAYVAVMDGCDQYCTYCAVPRSRGSELSRPPDDIIKEIRRRINQGQKEITLLGQNITRYGKDMRGGPDLAELIDRIVTIPGLLRLRFLTGHPKAFTQHLIKTMAASPVLCHSLHLPLQSGSNKILQAMKRGYQYEDYRKLVDRLRQAIPDLALSTDLIVGFPGESEKEFNETLEAVHAIKFDMAYCFKYSPRAGTAAAKMTAQLPQAVKEERLAQLLEVINQQTLVSHQNKVNQHMSVLVESQDQKNPEKIKGRTRSNHIVFFNGPKSLIGQEVKVRIVKAGNFSLNGEWIRTNEG